MSNESWITVVARFRAKPGKAAELRRELLALVPATRAEPGCVNYDLHESIEREDEFIFHENFADRAAFDAHCAAPYIERLSSHVIPALVEGEPDITLWRSISERAR